MIDSCDDCGACCQVVSRPPFYRVFDENGEDAWERLKADRPEILAEFLADYRARRAAGGPVLRHSLHLARCRIRGDAGITSTGRGPAGNLKSADQTAATPGGERASTDLEHADLRLHHVRTPGETAMISGKGSV